MDPSTSIQIVLGLLFILLVMALVFSWKNWRVHTIVLVVFNFFAAVAFGYLATRTLKTHKEWRTALRDSYQKKIDETQREIDDLRKGKVENEQPVAGILELQREVQFLLARRGRAWTLCTVTSGQVGSRTLTVTLPDGALHNVVPKSMVYVFKDKAEGEYIGEFRVLKATDKTLELELGHTPVGEDVRKLNINGTVSVYEVMPDDSRDWYAALDNNARKAFFDQITDATIRQKVQDLYDHDGQDATPTDPPESILVPVKFVNEYTATSATTDPNKDKETKFLKDEIAWLPKLSFQAVKGADDLIADGTAIAAPDLKPKFQRPFREYAARFEDTRRQMIDYFVAQQQTTRQIESVKRDIDTITNLIAAAKDENTKIVADLAKVRAELLAIQTYQVQVFQVLQDQFSSLKSTFEHNKKMAEEIFTLQWKAVEEANRRVKAAPEAAASTR